MDALTQARPGGLSTAEATTRLATDGPNAVAKPRPRRLIARIGAQLTDPLVALLLAAAVVTVALGDWPDVAIILLVITLNTAIGVAQEVRADRAIAALDDLTAPIAHVVRDGTSQTIPAAAVVRGDLVNLEAGAIVPADLSLVDAFRCQVDEAALTGESLPVAKEAGEELQAGTVVVTGRASGMVVRTGARSALGGIASLVATTRGGPTPLQRRLARLGRVIGIAAVGLCLLVFALGVVSGQPVITMALVAVSLVVAAVPESLPAVVTLALALGARRMAAHKAIPRNLHAVETLGCVTVLASDKTGTLTEGRMTVHEAVPAAELDELAEAAVLCSDAALSPDGTVIGDPLEGALVAFAAGRGLDPATIRAKAPRLAEHPFDQATRQMTVISRVPGGFFTICKGAPETVLAAPIVDAEDATVKALRVSAEDLALQGLRVIAVAAATTERAGNPGAPTGLRPLGVIAIGDPIRGSAAATAESFGRAGIRLILITGDHPATAAAIAGQVGVWKPGEPVGTGDQPHLAQNVSVFARTRPEQKLDIIAALQEHGHVVAMTGDGVNDAPALRRADIGVAMGGGTEVARQAADLVLVDDNLATVTAAVAEGRRVYDNIRRFLRYALSGGVAEVLVMLGGPMLGMAVPLLPGQILWVNLLTHGLPGVALGAEPAEADVLTRPPRRPTEQVLGAGLWQGILALAAALTAATLGVGALALDRGLPWQSMVFVTLGLCQLGLALAVRPAGPRWRNPGLLAAVALSAVAQVAAVALPALRALLGTEPLSLPQLAACVLAAAVPALAYRAWKRWRGVR
jgi:Ca2+-transporting ATPase